MTDVDKIRNLIFGYARAIDSGDFVEIGRLFRHGRIILNSQSSDCDVVGQEAITSLYEKTTRRYEDGTPHTQHLTTNVEISIEGEIASSISYFTVLQSLNDFNLQPIISGKYYDTFTLDNKQWFFETRLIEVTLIGDLSKHLLIDLPESKD